MMILSMKKSRAAAILLTTAVTISTLSGCGFARRKDIDTTSASPSSGQETVVESGKNIGAKSKIPQNSILFYVNDKGLTRLHADMEAGDIPIECNVLYDEGGSRPDVTVTDPDVIKEIYSRFADIKVSGKSGGSMTDGYHHVTFRLRNDTYVSAYFEGENLYAYGKDNYNVSGGGPLWAYVRGLQDTVMKENARTASSAKKTVASSVSEKDKDKSSDSDKKKSTASSKKSDKKTDGTGTALAGERSLDTIDPPEEDLNISSEAPAQDIQGSNTPAQETQQPAAEPEAPAQETQQPAAEPEAPAQETQQPAAEPEAPDQDGQQPAAEPEDTDQGEQQEQQPSDESSEPAEPETKEETENDTSEKDGAAEYTDIVRAYAGLLSKDRDVFLEEYDKGLYFAETAAPAAAGAEAPENETGTAQETATAESKVDPRLNYEMIREYFSHPEDQTVYYGLYDYNEDGIEELAVVLGQGDFRQVWAMYTFDGKNAVSLFTGENKLGYRTDLYVLPDKTFMVHGSGGALAGGDTICRIAEGAAGLEILSTYVYDEMANGNLDHISAAETLTDEAFQEKYWANAVPAAKDLSLQNVTADAEIKEISKVTAAEPAQETGN